MVMLSYVNKILTVYKNDCMYRQPVKKPSFITGNVLTYEPYVKLMDGKKLTKEFEKEILLFIEEFELEEDNIFI